MIDNEGNGNMNSNSENNTDNATQDACAKKPAISTGTVVTIGMFTAVLAVLSIISIPTPSGVPITLQTFAMALCGYVLGSKKGTASTIIYILLGAVGVPIFAGMTGGMSAIVGYSGGFIWGFIFLTCFCGSSLRTKNPVISIGLGIVGLLLCHLLGVIQFAIVASVGFIESVVTVSIPFLIKDIISVAIAYAVSIAIRKGLRAANLLD